MKLPFFIAIVLFLALSCSAKPHPEAGLNFTDYCKHFHYPVQIHDITTNDGYILRVFRVQKKATQIKEGLKPIFLQHGLLDSSDTWIINDEDKAPAFILANAGYDIWLGNSRGNKHSRKHVKYDPDKD
jgi:gastric triacylglycerol lipase